mmetsp:Transcript_46266/g.106806  ORF Transcript_46266/g.106806 Transcript_46266/m.106806 type:complete len:88 (-) Transcript_46266:283-546(-)
MHTSSFLHTCGRRDGHVAARAVPPASAAHPLALVRLLFQVVIRSGGRDGPHHADSSSLGNMHCVVTDMKRQIRSQVLRSDKGSNRMH